MVTLTRLPELAVFSQISDEAEPPKDAVSKMICPPCGVCPRHKSLRA